MYAPNPSTKEKSLVQYCTSSLLSCSKTKSAMRTIVEPSEADVVQSEEELLRAAPRPHERVVYWGSGSPQGTHCGLFFPMPQTAL